MTQIISTPITGNEDITGLSTPYEALVQFYHAFNQRKMGDMSENWLQSDEASMSNPLGGIKRGWLEISSVYDRIFNGAARVYVEFYDYSIHETGDMFLAAGRERGSFQFGRKTVDLSIRTSRIYKKSATVWKQVHHHGSIDLPELLGDYQTAVRDTPN